MSFTLLSSSAHSPVIWGKQATAVYLALLGWLTAPIVASIACPMVRLLPRPVEVVSGVS
ncbi:hypothetical protein [Spirosoma oryzae]|uniref:hypothetical protein n=1 Tax=Spirosoma oryzae TaxID=1469603 RepID=UPI001474956D|nr:hypothetical protein [Spirosoma oryzae]